MPALNINDLNNGKKDLDHIAEIATSVEETAVDRLGHQKLTVRGAINSLKAFNVRGAFVSGTPYAMKDVYTSAGIAYVVLSDHIASTVAADLAAGKVTVHQGATREDLAAPTGASLVGFVQAGAGAVPRTDLDKHRERLTVTDFLPKNYVTDGSVDYTTAVQKAVDAMGANSLLIVPSGVNVGVTRIAIDGRSDWAIRIDGKITNVAPKPGAAATDTNTAARGVAATFYVTNCSRFKIIGSGSIDPGYREAFCIGEYLPASVAAPCTDFEISIDVRGTGKNDNMHANRIRYCKHFVFRDMVMDSLTKKPAFVNKNQPYYYNWAETLLLWDCTDFTIDTVTSNNGAMNGIYIGSNCERWTAVNIVADHNAGSGMQLAWSSFGTFPRFFTVDNLRASFNRADTIDVNNTGPLVECNGVVNSPQGFYNGWGTEDTSCTSPTNDGSGVGTYINLKKLVISNGTDEECAKTGCYLEKVYDTRVENVIINKVSPQSTANGLHILRCTNIVAHGVDVNVPAANRALWLYQDNADEGTIRISNCYFNGKAIIEGGNFGVGSYLDYCTILANETVNIGFNARGNKIRVVGAGQDGMNVLYDNLVLENNEVFGTRYGILDYGHYGTKIIGGKAEGGEGGVRMDSCAHARISGIEGRGVASPGIHLLNTINVELSICQAYSTTGNSFRVENTCTLTHKWGNRIINGPAQFDGTYGINF